MLFLLIGCVSANDINTTEISAGDTDDATGAVNVDSTDENYNNNLIDESTDSYDSEILSVSSEENFTNENNLDNNLKDSEMLSSSFDVNFTNENNLNNDLKKEIINNSHNGNDGYLSPKSEILGLTNDMDILSGSASVTIVEPTLTYIKISGEGFTLNTGNAIVC